MQDKELWIGPAQPSDAPAIVDFQVRMALETEDLALDPEVVTKGVAAVFQDPRKGSYLVARRGPQTVASLLTLPEWSDWRNGNVLWIHSVFVVPEARGQGVFAAMYRSLVERVEADPGLRGLRLYVDKTNLPAQKVYQRLGMSGEHYHLFEWLK